MTNYQRREAKRHGLQNAIERADDSAYQQRMRELRAENSRRAVAAGEAA